MLKRLFAIALVALAALPAWPTSVLPLSLDEILANAAVAFSGTCLNNRTEHDNGSGLIVTYTTFRVDDVLKGSAGATYTIKQVGGELPGGAGFKLLGVPKFAVGQDYVVFLAGVSQAGFSSPVGLAQGRFVVQPGASGLEVTNGRDFREMTANIPESALPPGLAQKTKRAGEPVAHMGLSEFKQLVRNRVGPHQ